MSPKKNKGAKKDDKNKDNEKSKGKSVLRKRCSVPIAKGQIMVQRVLPPTVCCPPAGCPVTYCLPGPGCGRC